MASWSNYREPPTLPIGPAKVGEWPESEDAHNYDPTKPWRVQKYNPLSNGKGFADDLAEQMIKYGLAYGLVHALRLQDRLLRFADQRQTRFSGKPNRDGTNTNVVVTRDTRHGSVVESNGSRGLRVMWEYYAKILSALHREGQLKPGTSRAWIKGPLKELDYMMREYPERLEQLERERIGADPTHNQVIPGFEWVYVFGEHISGMMAAHQAIIDWAKAAKKSPTPYFPQAQKQLPRMAGLLVLLNHREGRFEEALGDEHFEDVLMDKRLWMIAPKYFCASGDNWQIPMAGWTEHLDVLKPQLRAFRKQLRERFDWRLLVDWGYGRLWKKLYLIQKPEDPWEKTIIRDFNLWAKNHSRLAWNLFAIHPIDVSEPVPGGLDPCSVCLSDFEAEEIVLETHCNHHFHPACLFEYWDDETRFQNRCPECRTSQGILRERVEFVAEREDKCYEAENGLRGLETAYGQLLQERLAHKKPLTDSPQLMDLWVRRFVPRALRKKRTEKKKKLSGWSDLS